MALSKILTSAPGASRLGAAPPCAGSPPPALGVGFFLLFLLFFPYVRVTAGLGGLKVKCLRCGHTWLKVRSTDLNRHKLIGLVSLRPGKTDIRFIRNRCHIPLT